MTDVERSRLLSSIAQRMYDFRQGVVAPPTPVMLSAGCASSTPPINPSPQARDTVERAFLAAGLRIIHSARQPSGALRPLGFGEGRGLGFGALFFTYRNCPNNCPLALWWGEPHLAADHPLGRWYPLFKRSPHEAEGHDNP